MGLFERKITVNTAINIVRTSENAYLIDCREKTEYAAGHGSGAVNWTIDKMTPDRVTRRFPDKTSIIYVIGNYMQKPGVVVKKFKKLGYKNAKDGGYMEEHHGRLVK